MQDFCGTYLPGRGKCHQRTASLCFAACLHASKGKGMKGDLERTLETAGLEEKGRGDCKLPILLPHKSLTGMLFASFPLHSGHDAINQSLYPICLAAGEVSSITHIPSYTSLPGATITFSMVRREEEGGRRGGKRKERSMMCCSVLVGFRVGWRFFVLLCFHARLGQRLRPIPFLPLPPFSHLDSSVSFSRSTEGRPPEAPRLFPPPSLHLFPSICEAEAIPVSHN